MSREKLFIFLEQLLGAKNWLTDAHAVEDLSRDWLGRLRSLPLGVAFPKTTGEVSQIVTACASAQVGITLQGGNTGLVGGTLISASRKSILLSLSQMNNLLEINSTEMTATVEAGVILAKLHEASESNDLMFPIHLGSEGSAQIGGLIATNAGGSHALRYGLMMDQVLGLQVVMSDGTIWDGLRPLVKDNTGYQLRRLFCGSEGTLGIITKAVLKLAPIPRHVSTALLGVSGMNDAQKLGQLTRNRLGDFVTGLEFFSNLSAQMLTKHLSHISVPLQIPAKFYVLIEVKSSIDIGLDQLLENLLQEAFEQKLVVDGTVAASERQRAELWRIREEIPEGQRLEGLQLKHDISVPVSEMHSFLTEADRKCRDILPGIRVNAFGHLGDGNIHYNLSPPKNSDSFQQCEKQLSTAIYEYVESINGSFAAEHGLGSMKVEYADRLRGKVERDTMRQIKSAFDPDHMLNPGVIT